MSDITFYPRLKKMISHIRNPPSNVSKYGNINAFLFLFFVVFTAQMEKIALIDPEGSILLYTLYGMITFLYLSMILEAIVAAHIFAAIRWRLTIPDFLAVAVLKDAEGSESIYRNTIVRFYRGQEINRVLTVATLTVALITSTLSIYNSMIQGFITFELTVGASLITSIVMLGHLAVSVISHKKREKWLQLSDDEIREIVDLRFQKKAELHNEIIESVPSMEELDDLLEQARLSNGEALGIANYLEAFLKSNAHRTIVLAIIVGVCTVLLLL
ncbi:MAG: hypothetical protein ACTSW7_02460 [Candidatus Thorarchaeota archaeon]